MKIALPTEGDQIFQNFGKCPLFTVVTATDGSVVSQSRVDAAGHGHAGLSAFLKGLGVDTVICGGIGDGAKQMLSEAGITLVSGISGDLDGAVASYLAGGLHDQGGSCKHEEHEANHSCDCGHH